MNTGRKASGAPSPTGKDAGVTGNNLRIASRNISYPDLRIASSERVSSESNRSGPSSTATTTRVEDLLVQLKVENQIKRGAENMLQVFDDQKGQHQLQGKDQAQLQKQVESRQQQVESQLDAANAKIMFLKNQLQDLGVASKSVLILCFALC